MEDIRTRYPQYQIGKGTYGFAKVRARDDGATLVIGAYTSIATDVEILLGGEHRPDWVTTYPFNVYWEEAKDIVGHPLTKGDVHIGNDVWIGTGAMILSGVTVGDGAVIGAKSVVAKDVPPYTIVVGNPAKIIRKRFDDATIDKLLQIQWWNWEEEKIKQFVHLLQSNQIQKFIDEVYVSSDSSQN